MCHGGDCVPRGAYPGPPFVQPWSGGCSGPFSAFSSQALMIAPWSRFSWQSWPVDQPKRTAAIVFLPRRLPSSTLAAQVRATNGLGADRVEASADSIDLEGVGYRVRVTIAPRLRDVMARANAIGRRLEETRRCAVALIVEFALDEAYAQTRFSPALVLDVPTGAWAPVSTGLAVEGAVSIPWQALTVTESLARLPGAIAYDQLLKTFYPKA